MANFGFESAFIAFVILFVLGRMISRSAMTLLDDEAKIRLVDASARTNWWYLPLIIIIPLMFWDARVGLAVLFVYVGVSMGYNIWWHSKNDMPKPFMTRIYLASAINVVAFVVIMVAYLIETS